MKSSNFTRIFWALSFWVDIVSFLLLFHKYFLDLTALGIYSVPLPWFPSSETLTVHIFFAYLLFFTCSWISIVGVTWVRLLQPPQSLFQPLALSWYWRGQNFSFQLLLSNCPVLSNKFLLVPLNTAPLTIYFSTNADTTV